MSESLTIFDSWYAWRRLAISLLIATVGNVGMWAVIVIMPALQSEFSLDRGEASLPYTATMIGYAIGNLLIGRIIDRFGVTIAFWGAACGIAGAMALATINGSFPLLLALQLVIGIGTATCFGPLIADVSLWFLKRRGIAVGIVASGNYLSGALWPWLLTDILANQGWRAAYAMLAVVILGAMLPLSLLLRRRLPEAARDHADQISSARVAATGISPAAVMWLLALAGLGCCIAMSMPQVHLVSFCVDLGYGPAVGAQMLSLMLLGGVVSRLVSGFIADQLGGVRTVILGSALQCIALFLFLPFDGLVPLYLISAIFGLSQGGIVPSYALVVREYMPASQAGRRVGFVMMTTIIGMALGGWMSGWIYDISGSYTLAFINGIGWNLVNLSVMSLLLWRTRRVVLAPAQPVPAQKA